MVINLKEKLLDKIGGIEFIEPNKDESWYNKGVRETKARIVTFFNENLIPEVPQYVADWYEKHKDDLDYNLWSYLIGWEETKEDAFKKWVNECSESFQTIINMHQFGYKIKEEKKYLVKLKGVIDGTKVLKHNMNNGSWYLGISFESKDLKDIHTKEELEAGGFGGVFNNPMFEVEEMKNND